MRQLQESIFSFDFVGAGDQAQVARLGCKLLYLLSHPAGSVVLLFWTPFIYCQSTIEISHLKKKTVKQTTTKPKNATKAKAKILTRVSCLLTGIRLKSMTQSLDSEFALIRFSFLANQDIASL